MIGIHARIEAQRALKALERLEDEIDRNDFYKLVGLRLIRWVDENFRKGGIEQRWAPLSPNTVAGRRAGNIRGAQGALRFRGRQVVGSAAGISGAKPLQDTGRLKQSFTDAIHGDELRVGTQSRIAEFHHFGTGPYTIRPRSSRFLHFMTASGPVLAREVHHPGIPERPLLPSDKLTRLLGITTINAELARITRAANKGTA